MRIRVFVVAAAVLCGVSVQPGAQAPQAPPTFRSGVDLVTIDVTVLSRGGEPQTNLRADDFTVLVDGKPRPLVTMRLVQAGPPALTPDQPPVAPSTSRDEFQRRFVVLVVDRDHLPVGEGQQMLEAASKYVDTIPAEDRIALWTLPYSSGSLRFTEHRDLLKQRLRAAVGTYRDSFRPWIVGRDEAIQIEENIPGALGAVVSRECYRQPETCPKEVENQALDIARDARQRSEVTIKEVGNLTDALRAIDGPKHIVLVTGGPVVTKENLAEIEALARRAALARVTVHALQVNLVSYQARAEQMRPMPAEINQSTSAAFLIAGATGGLALTPTTGAIGFDRLARDLSASYVLVVEATAAERDGKAHAIEVKVRDTGWGATVRARKSFVIDPNAAVAAPPTPAPPPAPATAPPPAGAPPEPVGIDPGDLADRLADYAERFERDITAVVAEERAVQIIQPWRGQPGGPDKEPALRWLEPGEKGPRTGPIISRRQTVADVLMAQMKDQQWVSYRDVSEVDGDAVRDRVDRVQKLFLSQAPDKFSQFQRIAMESSRYNLGDMKRDLNLPTVTLSLLRRVNHPRFEFKKQKDETIDGRLCRVVSYKEKVAPTLVSTRNSGDVFLYGRVWLDQADGRVRRTELRFDRGTGSSTGPGTGGFRSYIRVDYGPLEGTDTLVPVLMWEWHEGVTQLGRIGGDLTGVQCVAQYGKYRRFSVTTAETIK